MLYVQGILFEDTEKHTLFLIYNNYHCYGSWPSVFALLLLCVLLPQWASGTAKQYQYLHQGLPRVSKRGGESGTPQHIHLQKAPSPIWIQDLTSVMEKNAIQYYIKKNASP